MLSGNFIEQVIISHSERLGQLETGSIITRKHTDSFTIAGKTIKAIPFHKWASGFTFVPA